MRYNFFGLKKNSDFNDFLSKISISSCAIIAVIQDYDLSNCDIDQVKRKMHFHLDEVGGVLDRIIPANAFLKNEQLLREISKVQQKVLRMLPEEIRSEFDRKIDELKAKVTGEPHQFNLIRG